MVVDDLEGKEASVNDEVVSGLHPLKDDTAFIVTLVKLVLLKCEKLVTSNRMLHTHLTNLAYAPYVRLAQED